MLQKYLGALTALLLKAGFSYFSNMLATVDELLCKIGGLGMDGVGCHPKTRMVEKRCEPRWGADSWSLNAAVPGSVPSSGHAATWLSHVKIAAFLR